MRVLNVFLAVYMGLATILAPVIPEHKLNPPSDERVFKLPRLFTMLNLDLHSENGRVIANVKNSFTLFSTVVSVYLELYSSEQYTTSYQAMTMRSHSYIGDLNMGETLETSCPTNGETLYWLARVRYNEDGGEWKESVTETVRYDGDGKVLPIG